MKSEIVAVAMSGGVDSSVAAALLKEQGHDVVGITLQLWPKAAADLDRHHGCCSLDAVEDARRVASHLGIPYYVLDVQEEFQARVVEPFLGDYEAGRTPNPCISCNNEVKFDLLLRKARSIGAAALATGHYARVERHGGEYRLLRAADPHKDQSYVLYGLGQEELALARFPLGGWRKQAVREKARELGLLTADKPDSVEICFVTGGDYRDLLARRPDSSGEIRHVDGQLLGRHHGVWSYTVGQRSGLGALPRGVSGPLFVTDIDAAGRIVTMGPREALRRERIEVGELRFVAGAPPAGEFAADVRIRYGAAPVAARVQVRGPGTADSIAVIEPEEPLTAAAPGQAAVLYRGDLVLGGGRILRRVAEAAVA
ncbi:MAG TPA: tRNA 2-thiouridine(34) synthase MnmA [Candidatus Dormibacteraeota bacterium]